MLPHPINDIFFKKKERKPGKRKKEKDNAKHSMRLCPVLSIRHSRKRIARAPATSWIEVRDDLSRRILSGEYADGDELPSVRHLATERQAHHGTIRKAYDSLASEGVVTKRHGLNACVAEGGGAKLRSALRKEFIQGELPALVATMELLGFDWNDLKTLARGSNATASHARPGNLANEDET
jgi:DNA-binding transcriptional regulator YhcF (GntR family)